MQPTQERLMDAINEERERLRSRRSILGSMAKLTAGGALGVAFATTRAPAPGNVLAQQFSNDLDILTYALTLEHLEYAFYRDGLTAFTQAEFTSAGDSGTFALLQAIRDHERSHVEALSKVIGDLKGTPLSEATYDFGYHDVAGFLEIAMALENTGVAAYAGAAPAIADAKILATALGIHSVEARHAAYLNELNRMSPFPDAVDRPQAREAVLKVVGGFSGGGTTLATPALGGTAETTGETASVTIHQFRFTPASVAVPVGGTVTWTNEEVIPHTVTADDNSFSSKELSKGETFSHTFTAAGTVAYHCALHTNMQGKVVAG